MLIVMLYVSLLIICYGPSNSARNIFITTFLETGAFKWIPGIVMTKDNVNSIVNSNSLKDLEGEVNNELIDVPTEKTDAIEIEKVSGDNFTGTMMIVHDPTRVKVATTYPYSEYGKTLDTIVKENNAIGGINGGIYVSSGNKGGYPMGVVVKGGVIEWNNTSGVGYFLIGFSEDNILKILPVSGLSQTELENLIKTEKIRDAVTFQEEASDANNHFVKLIINGEKRETKGFGGGFNPRTAIGQRKDGTVLMLVTDGRGASGHLGASAKDLIDIMDEYGAVNAANIDGGSSSVMYYDNKYLQTSVTLYYSNTSWNLPEAFIVTK